MIGAMNPGMNQSMNNRASSMSAVFAAAAAAAAAAKAPESPFAAIANGDLDHVAEQAFFNVGGLDMVMENWDRIQKETK